MGLHIVAIVLEYGLHHVHHLLLRYIRQYHKSTIGQTLMRIDNPLFLVPVGRKDSHKVLRCQVLLLELFVGGYACVDEK